MSRLLIILLAVTVMHGTSSAQINKLGNFIRDPAEGFKKAEKDVREAAKKAERDAREAAKKAERDAREAAKKAERDAREAAKKAVRDARKAAEKAERDARKAAEKAERDAREAIKKAEMDAIVAIKKAEMDTRATIEKAWRDTIAELERAGENSEEAAIAVGHFAENQVYSYGETLTDAEKRVREGKIIDAVWFLAVDPLRHTEENLGTAVSESSLLNFTATAASSIYGGPSGAAAYAAWYTYKQTGDLEVAVKAGVIAGATAQGLAMANGMPSGTVDELTRKTIASASIGGAAVAASGGEEEDIIEGFVKGAALTAAREYYSNMTDEQIEGRAPTKGPIPKPNLDPTVEHEFRILVDGDGKPIMDATGKYHQIDIRSLPKDASHVGLAGTDANASVLSGAEGSLPMRAVAMMPYMNDMAYFHDQWAAVAQMEGLQVQATIIPATVLTVTGSDSPLVMQTTKEVQEDKKKD